MKAVNQQNQDGRFRLGALYEHQGRIDDAIELYRQAADQGNAAAAFAIGLIHFNRAIAEHEEEGVNDTKDCQNTASDPKVLCRVAAMKSVVEASDLEGVWTGTDWCHRGSTAYELVVDVTKGDKLSATLSFSPAPTSRRGSTGKFAMKGTFDVDTRILRLSPDAWIERPERFFQTFGLAGIVNPSLTEYSGQRDYGCQYFFFGRARIPPADEATAPKGRASTDATEAIRWFRVATEQGSALAQTYLGYAHVGGIGVPQDDFTAVDMFAAAAGKHEVRADEAMIWAYDQGRGLLRDEGNSQRWVQIAATDGSRSAASTLNSQRIEAERRTAFMIAFLSVWGASRGIVECDHAYVFSCNSGVDMLGVHIWTSIK